MFETNLRRMKQTYFCLLVMGTFMISLLNVPCAGADALKIGLNYPKTGPYSVQGLDQWRATQLATAEINAAGGILGKKVEIAWRDSIYIQLPSRERVCREVCNQVWPLSQYFRWFRLHDPV